MSSIYKNRFLSVDRKTGGLFSPVPLFVSAVHSFHSLWWAVLLEMVLTGKCVCFVCFFHPSIEPALNSSSYFNKRDLELTGEHLRHLDEEGQLIGVVFNDVVVHVNENPEENTKQTGKVNFRAHEEESISGGV